MNEAVCMNGLSLPATATMRPRVGVEPIRMDGLVGKAGPDGKTFNPRRLILEPSYRALVYSEPDSEAPLVRRGVLLTRTGHSYTR